MITLSPSLGNSLSVEALLKNIAQDIWAFSSFKEKYKCPEDCFLKLEISPFKDKNLKLLSKRFFISFVSSETVKTLFKFSLFIKLTKWIPSALAVGRKLRPFFFFFNSFIS